MSLYLGCVARTTIFEKRGVFDGIVISGMEVFDGSVEDGGG
jgi:hypothetical protein